MIAIPQTLDDYRRLEEAMEGLSYTEMMNVTRLLAKEDLYFLLRYVLSTKEWKNAETGESAWDNQWLLDRCRDIQFDREEKIRIWSRAHFKSTIQSFGESIRCLLKNPNETIGILSVTKSVADQFVFQVKQELQSNRFLYDLFPDILWEDPKKAPLWTLEKGFIVKRSMNLKDASLRGFGLLATGYTGHRMSIQIFDDAVNESNVTTPEMIAKTNKQWELALNTGMPGTRRLHIGTFYSHGDTYHHIANAGFQVDLRPCYEIDYEKSQFDEATGLPLHLEFFRDKPVLFSKDFLELRERELGESTFGVQMLCFPNAGVVTSFKDEWLRYYDNAPVKERRGKTVYIVVDPANEKKKGSSHTAMWVIGLGSDQNYYILDGVWDRLNLSERTDALFDLVRQWKPIEVRYEKYGFQADIAHIRYVQEIRNYRFPIQEVGGGVRKQDRIERLIPLFHAGRVYLPRFLLKLQADGQEADLVKVFIDNEFRPFPSTTQMDMLDAMARVAEPDMPLAWPKENDYWEKASKGDRLFAALRKPAGSPTVGWAGA